MNYQLKCAICGATCWVRGSYEPDTNATNVGEAMDACGHIQAGGAYTIVDEEPIFDEGDY